jgi:UDP-N-acetylglucosamine--N-acetylmuramyl-(pentapeptide) pyrophosphoryl-undecaprenol N-acetylglucosamine transferase
VAALLGKRTVVWEPNAYAGLANRVLSRIVDECLLVFEEAARGLKTKNIFWVGLPVRSSIRPAQRSAVSGRQFRILVFGGSQGARAINRAVSSWISSNLWDESIELIHQTGRYDFTEVKQAYDILHASGRASSVKCVEYIHDMDARYAWADLVICRAGASTAAELAACGKAAIFIPLPTAADDHQLKNAQVFERAGAAAVIEQKDLTVESLNKAVRRFQKEPVLVEKFETSVQQFASRNAAEVIAQHVIG